MPGAPDLLFDYPTYNPHFKMRAYRWMYAIAAKDAASSRWFDEAMIKAI